MDKNLKRELVGALIKGMDNQQLASSLVAATNQLVDGNEELVRRGITSLINLKQSLAIVMGAE